MDQQAKYGALPEQTSKTAQSRPGTYDPDTERRKRQEEDTKRLQKTDKRKSA